MARIKQITRTVKFSEVECVVLNLKTQRTIKRKLNIAGYYSSRESTMLKIIKKELDNEDLMPVKVVSVVEKEQLFAMLESTYLKYATPIERRGYDIIPKTKTRKKQK